MSCHYCALPLGSCAGCSSCTSGWIITCPANTTISCRSKIVTFVASAVIHWCWDWSRVSGASSFSRWKCCLLFDYCLLKKINFRKRMAIFYLISSYDQFKKENFQQKSVSYHINNSGPEFIKWVPEIDPLPGKNILKKYLIIF